MSLSEFEKKRVANAVDTYVQKRRPPAHIRSQLDIDFRITGQSVELFEVRPDWKKPTETMENSVAKATFVRTQNLWKVFWMRADLKWHSYQPTPTVKSIDAFLALVEVDPHACFWG